MVFHWSLCDSKSPQVSRTCLRILAVISIAVIWIVFTRPPTSKYSRLFNNPFVIVPFSSKIGVLILLFTFLQIYFVNRRDNKVDRFANPLLFVDYYKVWSSGTTFIYIYLSVDRNISYVHKIKFSVLTYV